VDLQLCGYTAKAILAVVLASVLFIAMRPDAELLEARRTRRFKFAAKLEMAEDSAQLVVAGNSKASYGVQATRLANALGLAQARNLAFDGLRADEHYLKELDRALVPNTGVIVWVLDSNQLRASGGYDGFGEARRLRDRSGLSRWFSSITAAARDRSRPVRLDLAFGDRAQAALDSAEAFSREQIEDDGSAMVPPLQVPVPLRVDSSSSDAGGAPGWWPAVAESGCSTEVIRSILAQVAAWRSHGQTVAVWRIPDSDTDSLQQRERLELVWRGFLGELRNAGACLVAPSLDGLTTWDGLHLDAPSGAILTDRLAVLLRENCGAMDRPGRPDTPSGK
jgi:hypothetical protein